MGNEEENVKRKNKLLINMSDLLGSQYIGIQSDEDPQSSENSIEEQVDQTEDQKEDSEKEKDSSSISSKSNESEEEKKESNNRDSSPEKSDNDDNNHDLSEKQTMATTVLDENDNKVSHTFFWNEGGSKVKLTGTFCRWKEFYVMTKDSKDGVFKYTLKLNKEKYEYKFIVDGDWKWSKKQKVINDGRGNTNNYLDLTNYRFQKESNDKENNARKKENQQKTNLDKGKKKIKKEKAKEEKNKKEKGTKHHHKNKGEIKETESISNTDKNIRKKKKNKEDELWKSTDVDFSSALNTELPTANEEQIDTFEISSSTNQEIIGKSKFLKYKKKFESNSDQKCFKSLQSCPHVNIDHTLVACEKSNTLFQIGLSHRFRQKGCTFIYYSHLKE